jgi:hypothetical protein
MSAFIRCSKDPTSPERDDNQLEYVSPQAYMAGYPGYYHTGVGVHVLAAIPGLDLVLVECCDTDGDWTDPGEVGIEIGMIINARISD